MLIVASTLLMQNAARAQEMQMPKQEHAMSRGAGSIKAEYPRLGERKNGRKGNSSRWSRRRRSRANRILLCGKPKRKFARRRRGNSKRGSIRIRRWDTRGMKFEADRWGAESRDSLCSRRSLRAEKLGLSRDVFGKEVKLAELEAEEQKIRVQSAVKIAFLRVLAAQELLDARRDMAKLRRTQPKPSGG